MKKHLILLHGALGQQSHFNGIIEPLSEQFQIHTFDFDGHGNNGKDILFSIQHFSDNLKDYIHQNQLQDVHIFGYSMGGYVALHTAIEIPDEINRIITLGTKMDWSKETAEKEIQMLDPDIIEKKVPNFAEKLAADHPAQDWKTVVRKTANMMEAMGNGERLSKEDFTKINCKVVLGIGTKDHMVSLEETEDIHMLLPQSEYIRLDGVKHVLERINPEIIQQFILEYMKD